MAWRTGLGYKNILASETSRAGYGVDYIAKGMEGVSLAIHIPCLRPNLWPTRSGKSSHGHLYSDLV